MSDLQILLLIAAVIHGGWCLFAGLVVHVGMTLNEDWRMR